MKPDTPDHCPICKKKLNVESFDYKTHTWHRVTCNNNPSIKNRNHYYSFIYWSDLTLDYDEQISFDNICILNSYDHISDRFIIEKDGKRIFVGDKRIICSSQEELENFLILI